MFSSAINDLQHDLQILKARRTQYNEGAVIHINNKIDLVPARILDEQIQEATERLLDLQRLQKEYEA